MKNILFLLTFCFGFVGFSQNQPPKMPKYIPKNAAGIFYYNVNEAQKKVKIKKDKKIISFSKALRNYNDQIKDISFLNSANLNEVELTVNSMGQQAYTNPELRNRLRKLIEEKVIPVKDSVSQHEKELNKKLKSFLSKKQFKKWLRYQRSKKGELLPKMPQQNNRGNMNNRGMNRRRGMGGMGRGRRF